MLAEGPISQSTKRGTRGQGGSRAIYSRDAERALRVARRIDVGMVLVNNYFRGMLGTPFGGTKHSGFGREHAIETLREFTFAKMIRVPSGLGTIPSWRAVGDVFGAPHGTP
jgi:acyl-CoA reductase-like NAD-dependent aldehyde dehydrogenase